MRGFAVFLKLFCYGASSEKHEEKICTKLVFTLYTINVSVQWISNMVSYIAEVKCHYAKVGLSSQLRGNDYRVFRRCYRNHVRNLLFAFLRLKHCKLSISYQSCRKLRTIFTKKRTWVYVFIRNYVSGKYDADFENGWGVWFSANNKGLIPWAIHSGRTKTMNTGPRGDHTLQGRGEIQGLSTIDHKLNQLVNGLSIIDFNLMTRFGSKRIMIVDQSCIFCSHLTSRFTLANSRKLSPNLLQIHMISPTFINCYVFSSTPIKYHQLSSTLVNSYQLSSTPINSRQLNDSQFPALSIMSDKTPNVKL